MLCLSILEGNPKDSSIDCPNEYTELINRESTKTFSEELRDLIRNRTQLEEFQVLEQQFNEFQKTIETETNKKSENYYVYLLIDPNKEDIRVRDRSTKIIANEMTDLERYVFIKFIKSIFYVGKGTGIRWDDHIKDAKMSAKTKLINEILSSGKEMVKFSGYTGFKEERIAFIRESMIISAIKVKDNLTNELNGKSILGLNWDKKQEQLFGSHLLLKIFGRYLAKSETQIKRNLEINLKTPDIPSQFLDELQRSQSLTLKEQKVDTKPVTDPNLNESKTSDVSVKLKMSCEMCKNYEIQLQVFSKEQQLFQQRIRELELQVNDLSSTKSKLEAENSHLKNKVQNSEAVQRDFVKLSQSLQIQLEKPRQSDNEIRCQHEDDIQECNSCENPFHSKKRKIN